MKPTLYLIPGTMCTTRLWSPLVTSLGDDFACEHLPIPMAPTLPEIVDALRARITAPRAYVVGFSLGAYLAASVAVKDPTAIGRLMLVSNTPCPLSANELRQRASVMSWVERHGYQGISRSKAASLVGDAPGCDAIVDTMLAMDAELGEAVFVHQMRVTTEREDLAEPLATLRVPVDLVFSEHDPLINQDWVRRFADRCPEAHRHALAGRGHMLPLERPEELAAVIRQSFA